jgi:hypothetical protein
MGEEVWVLALKFFHEEWLFPAPEPEDKLYLSNYRFVVLRVLLLVLFIHDPTILPIFPALPPFLLWPKTRSQ